MNDRHMREILADYKDGQPLTHSEMTRVFNYYNRIALLAEANPDYKIVHSDALRKREEVASYLKLQEVEGFAMRSYCIG